MLLEKKGILRGKNFLGRKFLPLNPLFKEL
jgi:hypothetical protein